MNAQLLASARAARDRYHPTSFEYAAIDALIALALELDARVTELEG